ncbi:MAG: hypothetical protein GTO02_09080 [Candidatus Dadabacteria bacterium]|nr:hypothetical protein [Candidatus Dadabacteria bacterium]NIQ14534.1 hypothetical protein [Candidatus Dadabacteria bacterium]
MKYSDNVKIERIKNIEAVKLLSKSAFRLEMFKKDLKSEFGLLTKLVNKIDIFKLNYTKNFKTIHKIIDKIVKNTKN